MEYSITVNARIIVAYSPKVPKIISNTFDATLNCTPKEPTHLIKENITVIILTFEPNIYPIVSAIENLPKNSPIRGTKIQPIIIPTLSSSEGIAK